MHAEEEHENWNDEPAKLGNPAREYEQEQDYPDETAANQGHRSLEAGFLGGLRILQAAHSPAAHAPLGRIVEFQAADRGLPGHGEDG